MKILYLFIVLLLVVIMVITIYPKNNIVDAENITQDNETFTQEDYFLADSDPIDFVPTYHSEENITFIDFNGWVKKSSGPVYIYTNPDDDNNSLQYEPPRSLDLLKGNISDFKIDLALIQVGCGRYKLISQDSFEVNGLEASQLIFDCDEFGTFYRVREVRITDGEEYIGFDLYSTDFEKDNQVFDGMLRSFIWE